MSENNIYHNCLGDLDRKDTLPQSKLTDKLSGSSPASSEFSARKQVPDPSKDAQPREGEGCMSYQETFRVRLRALCISTGRPLYKIAEDIRLASPTLSRYVSGQRTPDLAIVVRLARHFGVTTDWLLGLDEGEPRIVLSEGTGWLLSLYHRAAEKDRKAIKLILEKYE